MKKFFVFAVIISFIVPLTLLGSNNASFSASLPHVDVGFSEEGGVANFEGEGFFIYGLPGDPGLPVYHVTFVLPDNADVNSVNVAITGLQENVYSQNYDVLPVPPYDMSGPDEEPDLYWPDAEFIVDGRNTRKYGSVGYLYDNDWVVDIRKGGWKSVRTITVSVLGYNWNPATGYLKKLVGGSLSLSYSIPNENDLEIQMVHFSDVTARSLSNLLKCCNYHNISKC